MLKIVSAVATCENRDLAILTKVDEALVCVDTEEECRWHTGRACIHADCQWHLEHHNTNPSVRFDTWGIPIQTYLTGWDLFYGPTDPARGQEDADHKRRRLLWEAKRNAVLRAKARQDACPTCVPDRRPLLRRDRWTLT